MDLPQPPADQDLRNIIDKLAQFVARNGPEFENMTKNKQKNNPKFSFLFGGEHYHYYNYKVNAEQAILRQKNPPISQTGGGGPPQQNFYSQPPPMNRPPANSNWNLSGSPAPVLHNKPPPAFRGPPPNITNRPPMSRPQTNQNWNVSGPPASIVHNKPPPSLMNINTSEPVGGDDKLCNLEETIFETQNQIDTMKEQVYQSEQNLIAQRKVTEDQVQQMTEDTIRKSRQEHLESLAQESGMSLKELEATVQPIIESCTKETIGSGKVWIFQNANSHDRNRLLAHYLAFRVTDSDSNFQLRLHLIYLMNDVVHHCVRKNNEDLKGSLESVAVEMFCSAWLCEGSDPISREGKLTKLIKLWQEKSIFSNVTLSRMREIDETWKSCQDQLKLDYESKIKLAVKPLWDTYQNYSGQHEAFVSHAQKSIKSLEAKLMDLQNRVNQSKEIRPPPTAAPPPPSKKSGRGSRWDTGSDGQSMPHATHDLILPDLSRPPPGFDNGPPPSGPPVSTFQEKNLIPTLPYYDLPAGLIVPLIDLEDSGYKPLKAKDLRLPPPIPPTDRLLAALDQFYAPPSHDHPRDPEGWEMLGLYEWSRSKTAAIKKKADDIESGLRDASPPPSPEPFLEIPAAAEFVDEPPPVKRFRSRSRSRTRSRSRESTPESRLPRDRGSPSPMGDYALPSHLTKRSPSPTRAAPSPPPRTRKSSFRRSPTPPESTFQGFGNNPSSSSGPGGQIASSNKGHQMMQRMGWKGSGLGSSEDGIVEPISGGEVRDKQDQFRGVGHNADPFEAFRKSKAGSFYTRMKERDKERDHVMSQAPEGARHDAAGRAATKATAYGGSEAGAILGGAVGPPIIGGIIGGLVGEKVGEKSAGKFGVDETAKKVSDDLAKVVGKRNVDKMGEITLTALGYSSEEECICCPCMPASQSLFFIMLVFFGFNWYRLSIGIDYDWGCSGSISKSQTLEVSNENINQTLVDDYYVSAENEALNRTVFLIAYPCEWGFHYLVSGAAVWLAFLPFYITQLLGNCWRQCCCCLCDPLVCFACCVDVIKRYCCEIGRFNCISFIWHSMCLFQVCWACGATYWLVKAVYFNEDDYQNWDVDNKLIKVALASIVLDLVLAGSELFHKLRLVYAQKNSTTTHPEAQEMHQLNTNPC